MQEVMATLTASAVQRNLTRCTVIGSALDAVEQGRSTLASRAEAEQAAHQIVGSAGTFGLDQVSALAAELEAYFTGLADPANPTERDRQRDDPGLAKARGQLRRIEAELGAQAAGGHQRDG